MNHAFIIGCRPMVWFDLIVVVLYDVRVNAREWSIRAARDQITHRDVKGSLGACCWSSLSVLYLLFLQSVLYSSTNAARVCRVLIFMLILNGISGAQLLWSVFISTKKYCLIYTSLIMNVAYLGWCPTQTAYTAYSIVHIAQTGAQGLEPPPPPVYN